MADLETVKMSINIATQTLKVQVAFDKQDQVRDVENALQNLYATWRRQFPAKDDKEILAMMAYQFATHYHELAELYKKALQSAHKCEQIIDNALG